MLNQFIDRILSFLLAARSWCQWATNGGRLVVDRLNSSLLFLVGFVHSVCGRMIGRCVAWETLFAFSSDETDDISMVIRVTTTIGYDKRVQGCLTVQQFGRTTLFRVLIDGHEVVDGAGGNQQGARIQGAVYLPESLQWDPLFKKVKSSNTTSIRGRCAYVKFGPNISGVSALQATLIHSNSNKSADAKRVFAALEECIKNAAEVVNNVSQSNNNFHL
ncbi:expressed unknown protein [Seminavis robusta]|uniref:Uncharacterized protein n=1 Tax=Seminavis robusta TaxID=568900 RepID=A0A9N8HEM9_9STRA|nr:expressed unknown protein [Seminavis robusta]|eukprot:Sro414_g138410.1 n/a (218) ;mRNA; r:67359-68012